MREPRPGPALGARRPTHRAAPKSLAFQLVPVFLQRIQIGGEPLRPSQTVHGEEVIIVNIPSPEPLELVPPETIELAMVDPLNGMLAGPACSEALSKPFLKGYTPLEVSPCTGDPIEEMFANDIAGQGSGRFRDSQGHPDFEDNTWGNASGGRKESSKNDEGGLGGFLRSIFQ